METYTETVLRYRIMRHEELPEEHKAAYRADGIDPDTIWSLVWSFETEADAEEMLAICKSEARSYQTFKLVDAGEATEIERPLY